MAELFKLFVYRPQTLNKDKVNQTVDHIMQPCLETLNMTLAEFGAHTKKTILLNLTPSETKNIKFQTAFAIIGTLLNTTFDLQGKIDENTSPTLSAWFDSICRLCRPRRRPWPTTQISGQLHRLRIRQSQRPKRWHVYHAFPRCF